VPIILVGCKNDLRPDPNTSEELNRSGKRSVSFKDVLTDPFTLLIFQAEMVAQKFGAKYLECSSLKNNGVRDVFMAASQAALCHRVEKKSRCIII